MQTLTVELPTTRFPSCCSPFARLWIGLMVSSLLALAASAQSAATGAIAGRVFNAATKEYVRNAEVRVEGTNLVAYTEEAGYYRIVGVPAGQATVAVTYTASQASAATVTVAPGQ